MTSEFVSAAELMARVLGMAGYEFCVIDHPISSATDRELELRAEHVVREVARLVLEPSQPTG